MQSPNLADLIVMMLFNGSDATSAVAYAILPVLFQHLLRGFQSLASDDQGPARVDSDARRPYDVHQLESIILSMQNDSQSATYFLGLVKCFNHGCAAAASEVGGFSWGPIGRKLLAAAVQDSSWRCLEDAVQHHGYCRKAATQRLYKEILWHKQQWRRQASS